MMNRTKPNKVLQAVKLSEQKYKQKLGRPDDGSLKSLYKQTNKAFVQHCTWNGQTQDIFRKHKIRGSLLWLITMLLEETCIISTRSSPGFIYFSLLVGHSVITCYISVMCYIPSHRARKIFLLECKGAQSYSLHFHFLLINNKRIFNALCKEATYLKVFKAFF